MRGQAKHLRIALQLEQLVDGSKTRAFKYIFGGGEGVSLDGQVSILVDPSRLPERAFVHTWGSGSSSAMTTTARLLIERRT